MAETNGNGHALIEDIKTLAGQIERDHATPNEMTVIAAVRNIGPPFEQKSHTLMLESVDKIILQWVAELNTVRENTKIVEQMVMTQAAKVKAEVTKLHLLGVQAMKEAQRGNEVALHLADELDTMMADHVETH